MEYTAEQKRAYMKEKYKAGSEGAKARGKKIAAARAIKPEQEEMLRKMFYDETKQLGRDKTYQYLKKEYPDSHPTKIQIQRWLMKQEQYQIDRRPPKTKEIRSISSNIKRPRQLVFVDLAEKDKKYMLSPSKI